jgi:hypothetical protein
MKWRRARQVPAEVTSGLALIAGERVLAGALDRAGSWYVGSTLALYLPTGAGYRRVVWEQIGHADWQRDDDRLAVVEVAVPGAAETVTVVEIDVPGRLLELIRERVTKSLVWTGYAPVRGKSGVTVVARRSPSGHGPLTWSTMMPGLDGHDPVVRAATDRLLDEGARELADLEA